jgi:uncharacterized protein (UPF0332 family)
VTDENRRANIAAEMEKSRRAFATAHVDAEAGDFDAALNRLYYAAFHAATAVCLTEGLEPRTHRGARHLLNLHFVVPGRLDDRVSRALAALEDDRNLADYEAQFRADRQRYEARRADAERLIAEIERFLRSGGWI